mmetsp:Transcript_78030/g.180946  ORF Transcript_78030/g.180946 Transcript_78030/m.180946 type:complete len:205 (-) Transcript_78030:189-803(-)
MVPGVTLPLLALAAASQTVNARADVGNETTLEVCKVYSPLYTRIEVGTRWRPGDCHQIDCFVSEGSYPISTRRCSTIKFAAATSGSPYFKPAFTSCLNSSTDESEMEPLPKLVEYWDPNCTNATGGYLVGAECKPFANSSFVRLTVKTISIKNPAYSYLSDPQMTDDYPLYRLACGVRSTAAAAALAVGSGLLIVEVTFLGLHL